MAQQGHFSWDTYRAVNKNVWIAGREIGTDTDSLQANIRTVIPVAPRGIDTGQGFVVQPSRASPKAPGEATTRPAFALDFTPSLDEDTWAHIMAALSGSEYGLPKVWLPWAWPVSWAITTGRVSYSTPYWISGSSGDRGEYVEPIVQVRDAGELISTLTYAASSPSATEFTLTSTTADTREIQVGDQSANDGLQLQAYIWALVEVSPVSYQHGLTGPNNWQTTLGLQVSPSPVDYEADT